MPTDLGISPKKYPMTAMEAINVRRKIPVSRSFFLSVSAGCINMMVSARMNPVLTAIDPMALPKAISVLPRMAELPETMASGKVVQILTRVAPIMMFGTFRTLATHIVESMNQSEPLIIRAKPIRNMMIDV